MSVPDFLPLDQFRNLDWMSSRFPRPDRASYIKALEQNISDLQAIMGLPEDARNLGIFDGDILPDNATLKVVLQALETFVADLYSEAPVLASGAEALDGTDNRKVMTALRVAQVISAKVTAVKATAAALGVEATATDMGNYGGNVLASGKSVRDNILALSDKASRVISPYDARFGATGGSDDTASVQAAINYAIQNYPKYVLDLTGSFNVSTLKIAGGNGLNIIGTGVLNAISADAQDSLLNITMGGVMIGGFIKLNVAYRQNYACGLWIHDNVEAGTPQFSILSNICVNGAQIAARFGDRDYPSGLTSEVTLNGFTTYGCPIPLEVIGVETYLSTLGCHFSSDAFGGDTSWQLLPKRGVRVIGAEVQIEGGELIMAGSSSGYLVELQPLTSAPGGAGTIYGGARLNGVFCETAAPLCITSNPSALTISTDVGRRGLLSVLGCRGFHSQDIESFVKTDPTYRGDIVAKDNRFWFPGGTRTKFNVECGSSDTHVYIDPKGWGDGFYPTYSGVGGGTLHYDTRLLLRYQDPQSQALAVGANTIIFKFPNGADTARWEPNYNTDTGEWTALETLSEVRVNAQVVLNTAGSGTIYIMDNGTPVAGYTFSDVTFLPISWTGVNYASGRKLSVLVSLNDTANAVAATNWLTYLSIEGSVE